MRHGNKVNNLSRPKSERDALIIIQAKSLVRYKRLETTTAKAKVVKQFSDKLLFGLVNKEGMELERFLEKRLKTKDLNDYLIKDLKPLLDNSKTGGFTKIYKVENRKGDNSKMSLLKLSLEDKPKDKKDKKAKKNKK
ncbi:hypothetical protein JW978_00195 [Candidatus Dojkabacteria bacterium]|nr:hypothetical protein [Candidatus Dojkabacteria bacterium]